MPELADGTIVPSYLSVVNTAESPESTEMFGNVPLRIGSVKEIIYPTDKRSVSKKFTEYTVSVDHRDARGVMITTDYVNCYVGNMFGGQVDRLHYTLRPAKDTNTGIGNGSSVLILCVNGETANAVIVGGVPTSTDTHDRESDGHHLLWEFNGVRAEINKGGEFSLKFSGATKDDGTLASGADASASGTEIIFKKNGDMALQHGADSIVLDRASSTWKVHANNRVDITGDAGVDIATDAAVKTTSTFGTKLGGDLAVDALVKGTTYRAAETAKHSAMAAGLGTMAGGLAALASLIGTAGALLQAVSVAHKVPVAGPIAGSVPLQAAATALLSAVGAISTIAAGVGAVASAVGTFEGGSPTYLSLKNTTD